MNEATDKEIAERISALLDQLKWFHDHNVKIHINHIPTGWNLKFSVPDKTDKD